MDMSCDPDNWTNRAGVLLKLGFPELAVGDCVKACLLVDAARKRNGTISDRVNLEYGMAMWLRITEDPSSLVEQFSEMGDSWPVKVDESLTNVEDNAMRIMSNALTVANCVYDDLQLCQVCFPLPIFDVLLFL